MDIAKLDTECLELKTPSIFHLQCCECGLRHTVLVEIKRGKVRIAMIADFTATELLRRTNDYPLLKKRRRK